MKPIKQLPQINVQLWPHIIHMGFMTEVLRRTAAEWTQQNPCPQKLQPWLTAVETNYQKEDRDYKTSQGSDLTALVDTADQERDSLLNQVYAMVDTMRRMDALPTKKQAAETLAGPLDFYKPTAKMALRERRVGERSSGMDHPRLSNWSKLHCIR